ncbi:hypothetical protein GCM10029978_012520 [Actinoallomurus acanthiterrae]
MAVVAASYVVAASATTVSARTVSTASTASAAWVIYGVFGSYRDCQTVGNELAQQGRAWAFSCQDTGIPQNPWILYIEIQQ